MEGWKVGEKRKQNVPVPASPGGGCVVVGVVRNKSQTFAGVIAARLAPSAARISADPDDDVEALLPCLHTWIPQAVARMADVVETLKVPWPSPPVPTMSTRPPRYLPSSSLISGGGKRGSSPGILTPASRMPCAAAAMHSGRESRWV